MSLSFVWNLAPLWEDVNESPKANDKRYLKQSFFFTSIWGFCLMVHISPKFCFIYSRNMMMYMDSDLHQNSYPPVPSKHSFNMNFITLIAWINTLITFESINNKTSHISHVNWVCLSDLDFKNTFKGGEGLWTLLIHFQWQPKKGVAIPKWDRIFQPKRGMGSYILVSFLLNPPQVTRWVTIMLHLICMVS